MSPFFKPLNDSLHAWENSEESHKLIKEVNNYSTPYLQKATGMETWFTLPDSKAIIAPPKWKMTIVAFIGAYCISSLAQYILSFFLVQNPLLFNLFMNMILVISLTYLAMPLLSILMRRWLYPKNVWHMLLIKRKSCRWCRNSIVKVVV